MQCKNSKCSFCAKRMTTPLNDHHRLSRTVIDCRNETARVIQLEEMSRGKDKEISDLTERCVERCTASSPS